MRIQRIGRRSILMLAFVAVTSAASAGQGSWQVSKVTGEVWISNSGAQKTALTSEKVVQAGDDVRTGRNGRVLLTRGEEVIMISPNSEIAIPESSSDGMATTIQQRTGSATFEVEKRNVQHFKVETPYLAAVVKGTKFVVSVARGAANVSVTRGAVDVSDFKSGQHALVMPGQAAHVSSITGRGLSVVGPGSHSPILQGPPRSPSTNDLRASRTPTPRGVQAESRQLTRFKDSASGRIAVSARHGELTRLERNDLHKPGLKISAPIGDIKLDFAKVTKGLARSGDVAVGGHGRSNGSSNTDSPSQPSMTNNNGQPASGNFAAVGGGNGGPAGGPGNGPGGGPGIGNGPGNGNGSGPVIGPGNGPGSGGGQGKGNGHDDGTGKGKGKH